MARQRLFNQRIDGERFEKPEDVVRWMGALQAQDYLHALWAIGLRTRSATVADIEQAIVERKILRTWPMRGTLHFVPPEDAKWMLKLSAARMLAVDRRRLEQLEVDDNVIERSRQLFYDALHGDRRLTRQAMTEVLERAGIRTDGQRGYHILWCASQSGLICLGPMQSKQQTFVLLDDWVPHARELSRDESLAELAGRYFASHGPATVQDFAWWAGLTGADARLGLGAAQAGLRSEETDGVARWMPRDGPGAGANMASGVHLLPGFDEYLLGYRDRTDVLAAEHAFKIQPGKNGVFASTVVVAGQVVGAWRRTVKRDSVSIDILPFTEPGSLSEGVVEAATRYREFLGVASASAAILVA